MSHQACNFHPVKSYSFTLITRGKKSRIVPLQCDVIAPSQIFQVLRKQVKRERIWRNWLCSIWHLRKMLGSPIHINKQKNPNLLTIHSQNNNVKTIVTEGCGSFSIIPFFTIQQSDKTIGVAWVVSIIVSINFPFSYGNNDKKKIQYY